MATSYLFSCDTRKRGNSDAKGVVPLLARHFAKEFSRRMNKTIEAISSETMKALCQYRWPGNIRELQNVIERAVILCAAFSPKSIAIKSSVRLQKQTLTSAGQTAPRTASASNALRSSHA
jgi:DNA-binding NtrC family response regulator